MQSFSFYLPLWVRPVEVEADADTAPPEVADADVGDENVFVAIDADAAEDADDGNVDIPSGCGLNHLIFF